MPCYHFTYHGYGTWMPDHLQGYVRRKVGVLPADQHLAECYRKNQREAVVYFDERVQRVIVRTILDTA